MFPFYLLIITDWASLVAQWLKDPPPNPGEVGDMGSIPGSEDPPDEEMAGHSSNRAGAIPWTEEPGRLQSIGSQRVRHN